jgi:sulfate permease, SulP family
MIRIYRTGGREILLVAASCALVVVLPIESGILLAIVLSFVHSLYIVARPYCAELARVPGTTVWWPPSAKEHGEREDGVLVFAPAAPLNFTNAQNIIDRIKAAIAHSRVPVKLLVIEASGIIDIDYTGSKLLQNAVADLKKRGITVAVARLSHEQAQREAGRSGLIGRVGKNRIFLSVEDAVRALGPGTRAVPAGPAAAASAAAAPAKHE